MTTSIHTTAIVNAGKEAIKAIDADLVKLDASRKTLLSEKRKLAGLIKSYAKEVTTESAEVEAPSLTPTIKTGDAVTA